MRLIDETTLKRVLFSQIQENAIDSGSCHYGNYKYWCLTGAEIEKAISDIFLETGPFSPTVDPETLPIVQQLQEKIVLLEANLARAEKAEKQLDSLLEEEETAPFGPFRMEKED